MSFCSNCGKENPKNDKFCSACGNQLNGSSQSESKVSNQQATDQSSMSNNPTVETNQEVIFTAPANLFRGPEGVGGRINVTNQEVIFNAHKFNIQSKSLVIKIADIKEVEKRKTMLMIPNGVKIELNSGVEYKFVINKRTDVITHIKDQMRRISESKSNNPKIS